MAGIEQRSSYQQYLDKKSRERMQADKEKAMERAHQDGLRL